MRGMDEEPGKTGVRHEMEQLAGERDNTGVVVEK